MIKSSSSSQITCKSSDWFLARTELVRFLGCLRRRHTCSEARHSGIEASLTTETPQTHSQAHSYTALKAKVSLYFKSSSSNQRFCFKLWVFFQKMNVQVVFLLLFLAVGVDIMAAELSDDQGIAMCLKTSDMLWICSWYKSKFAAIPEDQAMSEILSINLTDLQKGNKEPKGKAKLTNNIILCLFCFFPNRMQIKSFLSFQSMLIFYIMQYSCSFVWPLIPKTHFIHFFFIPQCKKLKRNSKPCVYTILVLSHCLQCPFFILLTWQIA